MSNVTLPPVANAHVWSEDLSPGNTEKENEGGTARCSSWPCRISLAARATMGLFQPPRFYRGAVHHHRRRLVNLIILTASLVIVISRHKCGPRDANRRRRNAIHPVYAWRDGGCLHRRRRATAAAWRWRHGGGGDGGGGPERDAAWLVYSPRLHNALVSGVTGLHCVTLHGERV